MTQFQPLSDIVFVRRQEPAKYTPSGLTIPQTAQEKLPKGNVVAVGPDVKHLNVEDEVLFGKFAGSELDLGDEVVLMLREDEILAVRRGQ